MRNRSLLAALPLLALVLAGCSGGDSDHGHMVTCNDGSEIDYSQDDRHHDDTFDPSGLCAPPPLELTLAGVPATMVAYDTATVAFQLPLGGRERGHSMDNQVRASTAPGAPGPADGPGSYGEQVGRREHQDLPVAFDAAFMPTGPGTYYLRGVAEVDGSYIWSEESVVEVLPVTASGTQVSVGYEAGGLLGPLAPAQTDARLGDELVFQNDDVVEHVFTFSSGPWSGLSVTVPAGATSEPILLDVPAVHEVTGDDLPDPTRVTIRVA